MKSIKLRLACRPDYKLWELNSRNGVIKTFVVLVVVTVVSSKHLVDRLCFVLVVKELLGSIWSSKLHTNMDNFPILRQLSVVCFKLPELIGVDIWMLVLPCL